MKKVLKCYYIILATLFLLVPSVTKGAVVLPALISDNMVMQKGVPVHIWGRANVGEKITIRILNQNLTCFADDKGNWQLWLKPLQSGVPLTMTVEATNTITVKNILIGEVWLASGQSNMEWDVSQSNNAQQEIANAKYPKIRIFEAKRSFSDSIKTEIEGKWVECSPETIAKITAAGYFFSRDLNVRLKQPIGLIEAAWGATRCEAWTPLWAQKNDPKLSYWQDKWKNYELSFPLLKLEYEKKLAIWKKQTEDAKNSGKIPIEKPDEPKLVTKAKPSAIFNGVIAPLSSYTIKGAIWYQGENNAYKDEAFSYRYLFPTMIKAWRETWKLGDFPFIFVQLSTLNKHPYWPVLRESQTEALKLKNTGMVVTYDIGDSVDAHYKNKKVLGERLALVARSLVYGEKVEASGPKFKRMTFEGAKVRIWFDHGEGLKSATGSVVTGFQIAGADGKLFPAVAIVDGQSISLSNPSVSKPTIARYAFKDAVTANLINNSGLPAVPFRTDVRDGL